MGSCISSHAPAAAAPAGTTFSGEHIFSGSSGSMMNSMRWREWKKKKVEEKKKGGRSLFNWKSFVSDRDGGDMEKELHRVPDRMFENGASEIACLFTQQGKKGVNQDAMIVWENFTSTGDSIFCGVFDGHGPFGHVVARKVRDSLPLKLSNQLKRIAQGANSPQQISTLYGSTNYEEASFGSLDNELAELASVDGDEKLPEMYVPLKQALLKTFKKMDKELELLPSIDCFCSGTTAVTIVKQGQDLIIGNLGDSRAILGSRDKDNNLVALQLTVDLKPNLPKEAARIQQCKGRVFALQDEPEVVRVWLPNSDSPGLAMARAFGDFCLKEYGLISIPDISYRRLTDKDEFIVLATDGIWDVLSIKEVVDVVASAPTRATAARYLVDSAVRAWRLKYPTSKIDDCAAVCLFLGPPSSYDIKEAQPTANMKVSSFPEEENSARLHSSDEIVPDITEQEVDAVPDQSQSTRSLAECISIKEEEEWSALEGVTRVNSLLNLPRFLSRDKLSTSWRKWL
ncbi:putative protein phosphatase 2C 6 [Apostasia shenzhenica]|uniref:protein-serine/threonine phosphatase n=1 Tax=Apostasia shenzhenica TaxID=1088818 RepID=A0A2I0A6S0_9ASPA|nr:putative protein phosphatase 2C 6 [Apostasia shenzhenica]